MIYKKESDLERSQRSISYYLDDEIRKDPIMRSRHDYYLKSYPHMLIEDVQNSIIPIGGHSEKKPFRVYLEPSDSKVEQLITRGIARQHQSRDLPNAIWYFFEDCVGTILSAGKATYEIVYLSLRDEGLIVEFRLVFVQPHTVKYHRGKLVQYVPASIARERNINRFVELSPDRILAFKPPTNFSRNLNHLMQSLAILSDRMIPDFAFHQTAEKSARIPFDSSASIRARKLALADVGKPIGWNVRSSFQDEILEHYLLYRALIFERFKIDLRNEILKTLNEGLDRVGKQLGFSAQIRLEGLPTLADVAAAQSHLASGDLSFKEIMEPFWSI